MDVAAGEFWVNNPFQMPEQGLNLSAYERNRLFINHQGGQFLDGSYLAGVDIDSDSRAVVTADFNRDGRMDILVGSVGGGPLRMFLNDIENDDHSIGLNLIGTTSNRSAIGARVVVETAQGTYQRDAFAANGCMGQGPPEVLIGIGNATEVKRVRVRWPDGQWQEFDNVPVDASVTLKQGSPNVEPMTFVKETQQVP